MSNFLKYLGVVILLIGVAILAVSALTSMASNSMLMTGLCVAIFGYIIHILIGRRLS